MRIRILLLIVTLAITLSGCSTVPEPRRDSKEIAKLFEKHKTKLEKINNWDINARTGFSTADDSGSVSMFWKQNGDAYQISLIAPLGQGRIDLTGEGDNVVLNTSSGKTLYGESAEQLILQATGFIVPVSQLRYWIKGLPGPELQLNNRQASKAQIKYYNDGTIASMQQAEWNIEYLNYEIQNQTVLPQKLKATNKDIKIKIVIKEWLINE